MPRAKKPRDDVDLGVDASGKSVLMPRVGFGTYRLDDAKAKTLLALRCGYTAIDTAYVYGGEKTEKEVGKALKEWNGPVFLTTKHWRKFHGYTATLACLDRSLSRLQVKSIDLYLMHWPGPGYWAMGKSKKLIAEHGASYYFNKYDGEEWSPKLRLETWRAMEDAQKKGLCRSIGVCNFTVEHLEHLLKHCRVRPCLNQVEVHPYCFDQKLFKFCAKHGIQVQAYASLGGQDVKQRTLLEDPVVVQVAQQQKRSPAQVLLKWAVQHGCIIIPKASSEERMQENRALDFELTPKQMTALDGLSKSGLQRRTWKTDPLRDEQFF